MNRKVFTDYCLPLGTLKVYPRIPIPLTVMLTKAYQLKKYVQEWYAIDDDEREHRIEYARRMNREY